MGQLNVEGLTVLWVDAHGEWLADGELSAAEVDLILWVDALVVLWVRESQWEHTLLLQVGLVDTSEGAGDDGKTSQVTWLKGSVLAGGTLTVVPVTDNNPWDVLGLVVASGIWDTGPLTIGVVLDLVSLTVGLVGGTDQHVVGDVVEVTSVLQPWAGHGDMVSGGLALALDEDWETLSVLSVPCVEWLKKLETVGGWGDSDVNGGTLSWWSLVSVHSWVESAGSWERIPGWCLEHELVSVLVLELIGQWVEVEGTSDGHGDNQVWGGDEGVGGWVGIVTSSEVTVVGREDGVCGSLWNILAVPLSDTWTAGVGENHTTELLEGLELAITLNGGANLLGTRGNGEKGLGLHAVVNGVTGDGGTTGHILVGRVGARSDKTDLELLWPVVVLNSLGELRNWGGKIWGEWTVDVWLELGEVDLDDLIVLGTLILAEVMGVGTGEVSNVLTLGDGKVIVHAVVEWEEGGGGTNLSTHVANGSHTSARDLVDTWAEVLNNGTGSTLDGEDTSNLEDDI